MRAARYDSVVDLRLFRERMRERNLLDDIGEIELAAAQTPEQRFSDALPRLKTEVWAGTGHFPHLAHPSRFAQRLAATARWRTRPGRPARNEG